MDRRASEEDLSDQLLVNQSTLATSDNCQDSSGFTDDLSDDERIICLSPTKSATKTLKRPIEARKCRASTSSEEDEEEVAGESSARRGGENLSDIRDIEERCIPTDADFQFKEPQFRKKKFTFHPFLRGPDNVCRPDVSKAPVEVIIPEQLAASYGLYIWPSAPVLAWYLWLNQNLIRGKRILELGAGTALPGLLAGKLDCQVILTDCLHLPHCLENCREGIRLNDLQERVEVQPLTWGFFTSHTLKLKNRLDYIIGSDLFFDPEVFEPLIITVSWLLKQNPGSEFLCTVQERSADWSIESLLLKWGLRCTYEYPSDFLSGTGLSEADLTGDHTIFLLKIKPAEQ